MMKARTPGPWHTGGISDPLGSPRVGIWGPTPPGAQSGIWIARDVKLADARLIAAAPAMYQELELAADTFRDFAAILRAIRKEAMSAAADIAERHIREYLASIGPV